MIDTLKLSFTDYEVKMYDLNKAILENISSSFGVKLQSSCVMDVIEGNTEQKLLFIDTDGVPCYGKQAYLNTKDFNVDLYNGLCVVQFSAPKVLTGKNYYTSSREETRQSIQKVQRDLSKYGIKTNLENANVIRVDLTNTIQTKYTMSTYMPVLSMLNGKRAKDKRQYNAQTMLWGNTQIQVCCYDKIAEILSYDPGANIEQYPQNSFRAELRLLSKKKVQSSLEIKTGAEIYKHWDNIKESRENILRDFIFKTEPDSFRDYIFQDVSRTFTYYAMSGSRYWLREFFYTSGLVGVLKEISVEEMAEIYRNILIEKGSTDGYIYKAVSTFKKKVENDLVAHLSNFGSPENKYTYAELYEEIYTKVLSA